MLSMIKPRQFSQESQDECWVKSTNKELDKNEKIHTWELVLIPLDKNAIDTKCIFGKVFVENGQVAINKAILV